MKFVINKIKKKMRIILFLWKFSSNKPVINVIITLITIIIIIIGFV